MKPFGTGVKRRSVLWLTAGLTLAAGGALWAYQAGEKAQSVADTKQFEDLATAEIKLDTSMLKVQLGLLKGGASGDDAREARENNDALTTLLEKAGTDPAMARAVINKSMWQFYLHKAGRPHDDPLPPGTEETFRLNMLQVEQNQRIIELLSQMAAKGTR